MNSVARNVAVSMPPSTLVPMADWAPAPAPRASAPLRAMGTIGEIGADCSKALPISHGRPCFFISLWRSRRVMSRPTA